MDRFRYNLRGACLVKHPEGNLIFLGDHKKEVKRQEILIEEQAKWIKHWKTEIEQLKKEKEWLIARVVGNKYSIVTDDKKRMNLLRLMQQTLKKPLEIITGPAPPEEGELKRCKRYYKKE